MAACPFTVEELHGRGGGTREDGRHEGGTRDGWHYMVHGLAGWTGPYDSSAQAARAACDLIRGHAMACLVHALNATARVRELERMLEAADMDRGRALPEADKARRRADALSAWACEAG